MVSDNTYSFVSGFFHSTWWLWDSSTFLRVSASHSFILMRIISLYRHAMFVNPAICWWILGISRFGYWKERCNKISCISLPVYIFLFFLCKYLGIKWLHYLVSVYLTLRNQEVFFLSSVQFSRSVVSDSLWPHEQQHARHPCPLPTSGVYPNPCLSSRWCHPTISSSVVPFSSCPQSFLASGSFQMSQLFASGGQSIGVSFSFNISPSNEHPELISFRMDWLDLLAVQGTLKSLL